MPRRSPRLSADARPGASHRRRRILRAGRREEGQSLVEFALILTPLLFLLLGIVQFGFIFQAYVTLSTAAREAARDATIYVYDRDITQSANDLARNNVAKSTLLGSFNGLSTTSPNFSTGGTWTTTTSGSTITATNGDMVITYTLPATVTDNDPRVGWRIRVKATYHQDIIIPLIGAFLPKDASGRLPLGADVTMVIN
jgi:Flp pilus assembly protein TadG